VDASDDAVRDAPPGFGLGEWFVNALAGLGTYRRSGIDGYAGQVCDTWRGSLDSLRDLSATCSRKWLLS